MEHARMTTEAVRLCNEHDQPFERLFRYQYVISRSDLGLPGFTAVKTGGYVLQTGVDLPCHALCDAKGHSIGFVFGQAVTHAGETLAEAVSGTLEAGAEDARDRIEDILVETVGRFGVLVTLGGHTYFYQDASGCIGAVANADINRISASLNLCLDRPALQSPRFITEDLKARHCEVGLHFTEDDAVQRINPSYRFDLTNWEAQRFWPREDDLFEHPDDQYAACIDEIILSVRAVCQRMTTDHPVTLSLSGGYDSRAIYAIADIETRERFAQIFSAVHNKIGWYDAMVASAVCALDGLGLEIHQTARPRRLRTEAELARAKIAFSIGAGKTGHVPIETQLGSYAKIIDNAIVMRGQQVPILKALFVRNADPKAWTPEFLIERVTTLLGCAEAPSETKEAIAKATLELAETYPEAARARIVDLLVMEAVNGPGLAEMFTGFCHAFYISPFNSRRLVQLLAGFNTVHRSNLSTFHHLLMRADARTCGLATAGQVKQVRGMEEDDGIIARFDQIRRYSKSYHDRIGEKAPAVQFHRFSTFGASQAENSRKLRRLFLDSRNRS